ncbi:MAG: hypothetical protein SFU56_12750 [Capsulimonadales bacterium]|nr:hypothetical protein [Capsulimonadales bacterium]
MNSRKVKALVMEDTVSSPVPLASGHDAGKITPEQLAAVFLAIGQVVSPALVTSLSGRQIGDTPGLEPLTTPAGYAFIIWSPIVLGSLAFAVYQALPAQTDRSFYPVIRRPAIVVFTGFTLWLVAAVLDQLAWTVLIFVAMHLALWRILPVILSEKDRWSPADRYLAALPFSLYLGWTTIAIFANLASALTYYGLTPAGTIGLLWQTAILVAATVHGVFGVRRTAGDLPYSGTLLWALTGIVAKNLTAPASPDFPPVAGAAPARIIAAVAAVAAGVLVGVTVFARRTARTLQ